MYVFMYLFWYALRVTNRQAIVNEIEIEGKASRFSACCSVV